jgi:CDP-glucose 4,6-dehydratase
MFGGVFKNRNVLVTGHTGFKGSWLCEWLNMMGANVSGISLEPNTIPNHFVILDQQSKIKSHICDINDLQGMLEAFERIKPEIVFHLAAQPIVSVGFESPELTFRTNAMGSIHILEAVRRTPSVEVAVMITSDKCYENVEWEYGYRETDRLGGADPYSASKACAEIAISCYTRSFFSSDTAAKIVSARAGNVIGGGDWAANRIIPDCIRAWSEGRTVTLRNPGSTRPWQHVLEPLSGYLQLAQALLLDGKNKNIRGQSFNFGPASESNHPVLTVVKSLASHWPSAHWDTPNLTQKMHEAGLLNLSCDKALFHLAWRPTLSFAETMTFTGQWYQEFYASHMKKIMTKKQIETFCELAAERGLAWSR